MKSMVLMAAAALALASCAKENINEQNNGGQKFAEVSFKAEIPDYQATKSTIDVDDLTFNTRWAEGDQMGMSYSYGETDSKTEKENVPAKYSKDGSYTVSLPTEYNGRWDYYVYYPYQSAITSSHSVEIPFGSERTQAGNAINSAYDIMHGLHGTKNSAGGKEEDGSSIHFDMERLTSLLHFHFTSSLNEKVLKATLSVDGDPIAADNITLYVDMENYSTTSAYANLSNSITLSLKDVNADDFSLWFNILPYEKNVRENGIKNIKLVVETETKTFSITNTNTTAEHYEANKIHSITANVPDSAWKDKTTPEESKVFFYESFDKNDGTGGNDDKWSGSIASSDAQYDNEGWTGTSIAGANQCVKMGGSNTLGTITSPALGISSNTAKISFMAAAWNGNNEKTTLNVSISGTGSIDTKSVTIVKGAWTAYTYTISGADKDTKVTFSASQKSNNRFFLDEVYVYTGEKPSKPVTPTLTLSKESVSVEASATEASFDIQSNTDWTVSTDAHWIKSYDKDGKENGTVTIKFDANTAATARTATFTVKTANNTISKTFTLTQKGTGAATTNTVTYDFTKIDGFADWDTGYSEHAVNYTEAIVTFKSANRNTSTIKDQPVTKGGDVSVVMTGTKSIKSVKFVCKQWGSKTQTIILNTSTDGGKSYTATSTKSSNFTLEATNLSDGINAVKFTFSSQKDQVGISSLEITYNE